MPTITSHLETPTWTFSARADGSLTATRGGVRRQRQAHAAVTAMGVIDGPQQRPWRLVTGHSDGAVTVWSLPNMLRRLQLPASDSAVTAVTVGPGRAGRRPLLLGDAVGRILLVDGDPVMPPRTLGQLEGRIDSLRLDGGLLRASAGWQRWQMAWTATALRSPQATPVAA